MAGRPPSCLLRTARSSCRRSVSRAVGDQAESRIGAYITRSISGKPYSTPAASNEIQAAPEIDLNEVKSTPSRIVPASPSYFTSMPRFTDELLSLQALYRKHKLLPTIPAIDAPRRANIRLAAYRSKVGELVQVSRFGRILRILRQLNLIRPELMPTEVKKALDRYLRPSDPFAVTREPEMLDEEGKSKGIGRRKASSAKVYLVEGEGEVLVNGKSLLHTFPRLHDRESAIWPLKITNRVDKYNVWALVSGGGTTGQAEAITLGLAKALMVHEPGLKPILRRAGCVTRDMRRVERKKHGHLKARKMPQWVKR